MEPYFWLVIVALAFAVLSALASVRSLKVQNVGTSRLIIILNVLTILSLVAAIVMYLVAGVSIDIEVARN